ncbi:hypothetical protein [Neobacillus sp. 19]|uniref:hypothetical protein n=1 Tax=Neobacillus sp. 19 TaxID=3394458 RepID=UPI003BF6E7E7
MGLYINKKNYPEVYKNNQSPKEPNQQLSRQDSLSELINEQQKANAALTEALAELGLRYSQQEESKINQWNQIDSQLQDLKQPVNKE